MASNLCWPSAHATAGALAAAEIAPNLSTTVLPATAPNAFLAAAPGGVAGAQ